MKTKNITLLLALFIILAGLVRSDFAQDINNTRTYRQECDSNNWAPIRCGYFGQGYLDGVNDANNNLDNDYKRHDRKLDGDNKDYYRDGYDKGYASIIPFARWTNKQKDVYEQGYDDGDDDKDRGISRLPARYEGQYDKEYEAYFRRGYFDGYDQRDKRYDLPLGPRGRIIRNNTGTVTGVGTVVRPSGNIRGFGRASGMLNWSGRVDRMVNIIVQGNTYRVQTLSGNNLGRGVGTMSGALPRRQSQVSVRKRDGRGAARVIQQPSRVNNYTAIIQVADSRRGSDNYRLDISWQSSNALETYSSGKLRWRGRVDQTVNIRISGADVENVVLYGKQLTNVTKSMIGYLARRRGTVRVRKLDGRGTVSILEQPSRQNNYVAVIRVFDPKSGSDEYDIEVNW